MRVWANRKPKYDSGSRAISPSGVSVSFTHDLGRPPGNLIVDAQFKGIGYLNQESYGGDQYAMNGVTRSEGAYWFGLTSSGIQLRREAQDVLAAQVRVRIWKAGPVEITLPFVRR